MTGIKKIEVYYHNDLVGYLAETPNRLAAFQYADSWGQLLLDRYLGSLGVDKHNIGVLDRLAYIGKSGMCKRQVLFPKKRHFIFLKCGILFS